VPLAETALPAGIAAGDTYLNIHTTVVPIGEIRGFLVQATPEPATFLLIGMTLIGLVIGRREQSASPPPPGLPAG
jgi:hypothetical protein